jgi:mevalonate kinase
MIINIPRKTFCVGEYGVLHNGQALIINHGPVYSIKASEGDVPSHLSYFANINKQLSFEKDKGFGASSAEFISYYYLQNKEFDLAKMQAIYKLIFTESSGADMIAQLTGKISLVNTNPINSNVLEWNFKDLDFCIIKTGYEISTFKHLQKVNINNVDLLKAISAKCVAAFADSDANSFLGYLKLFYNQLKIEKLVDPRVETIIDDLSKIQGVRAIKGCGAFGTESIFCVYDVSFKEDILKKLKDYTVYDSYKNLANKTYVSS